MTALIFSNYSVCMDADLKSLEGKITQFVELCQRLRADNQQLRQAAGARQQEMMLKARELEIKSQELGIKGYEAETARMAATQPPVFKSPYGEGA